MSSKRWARERKEAEREARIAAAFAAGRERQKGSLRADRLIARLPRQFRRDESHIAPAEALCRAVGHTKLVRPHAGCPPGARGGRCTYVSGIAELLAARPQWIRQPETWEVRTCNARRQFASLARHLLCRYPVPACLDGAWFDESYRRRHQQWFIFVGRGGNIRHAPELPCVLTRRAAHLFTTEAPDDIPVRSALRWAQLRAIGLDERWTRAILGSRMAHDFAHDDFWLSFARFLVRHPDLAPRHIGPIVDFIHHRRHGGGEGAPPAQPNYSMTGRSPASLLREVNAWHRELAQARLIRRFHARWTRCDIPVLDRTERTGATAVRYRIRELLSAEELRREGRTMRHCVATYAPACERDAVRVFSLTRYDARRPNQRLTIAVRPSAREITEARGVDNALPTAKQRRILEIWARAARLTISPWA